MKKHIVIAAGLAVLSTSAYATKARMEALSQEASQGSFFIEDTRNVFRNASAVNNMANHVVTEWGSNAANSQNPEGGFFRSAGQFNYGIYLNSDVNSVNHQTNSAGSLNEDDRITAFLGGDMGVKWGVSLFRASSEDETAANKLEHNSMGVGVGVERGPIDGYVNFKFKDEAKGATASASAKSEADEMQVGVGYDWMSYKFYVEYNKEALEVNNGTAKTDDDETTTLTVGVGHTYEVSASSRVFTSLHYENQKLKEKVAPTNTQKTSSLPLTVGFEADATSWLTLRGSIKQAVIINTIKNNAGKKKNDPNTTGVAAGATLNFGKLKVDGMIGTGGNNGDAATAAGTETGALSLDRLMTQVAVHYWF